MAFNPSPPLCPSSHLHLGLDHEICQVLLNCRDQILIPVSDIVILLNLGAQYSRHCGHQGCQDLLILDDRLGRPHPRQFREQG